MAAPRVERGRLDFDGQFWGLSNRWSASLLAAPFVGAARHELAKFGEWPETCFAFALAAFALLAWRRVDAGK